MNKKRLSVVMAGAMLATSVAPVLAAPVEYGTSQIKLVEKEVLDLVNNGKISANTTLKSADFVSTEVASKMNAAYSVYGVRVLDEKGKAIDLSKADGFNITSLTNAEDKTLTYNIKEIESILKSSKLVADMTIQVVERENSKFLGEVIPGSQIVKGEVAETNKFKYEDLTSLAKFETATGLSFAKKGADDVETTVNNNKFIKSVSLEKGVATITLNAEKDITAAKPENITIEVKEGSPKLYFALPVDTLDENATLLTDKDVMKCVGFVEKATYTKSIITKANPELKAEYKLVDDSTKYEEETLLASGLYDGLALTAKGTEILADLTNAAEKAGESIGKLPTIDNGTPANTKYPQALVQLSKVTTANGVSSFTITYYNSKKDLPANGQNDDQVGTRAKVVTVKSTNSKELNSLYAMLTGGAYEVGIVAGANRYETAVNVAKANKKVKITAASDKLENNIVLVNGESLVDGLAAAPLAAKLKLDNKPGSAVLLSKTDSLPKETKEYLENLVSDIAVSARKHVTINLLGGEAVLSESLVDELKEMGFKVERFGGDNREETSLEVAREILKDASDDNNALFVVGANGEADAMSIASEASKSTTQTPIIVAKAGGLTKNAVRFIKSNAGGATGNVDVIGGESVVSKAEYDKIDEVTVTKVDRVAGENRFETNAKIIDKYASNFAEVVLVKDGISNKNELIDALSAANYAAGKPIVLATDKITDTQKTAILNKKATKVTKLTQVGQGVARTTLEAVAEFLGLSNVK